MKRRTLGSIAIVISLCGGIAQAGPYEDAQEALEKQDYATAAQNYALGASRGDARSQVMLGTFYKLGAGGIQKDLARAAQWFKAAADQNWTPGQVMLGELYAEGLGVTQSWREAIRLYNLAADKGDPAAQNNLGDLYFRGNGVWRNNETAIKWYQLAARSNFRDAQFNMGHMLQYGLGINQNLIEASRWYGRAAEQGHPGAQMRLGVAYLKGDGVLQDYAQAVKLFRLSAQQGFTLAAGLLGEAYVKGEGVPVDPVRAYVWLNMAASSSDPELRKQMGSERDMLATRLTPQELQTAQAMGRRCIDTQFADCGPDSKVIAAAATAARTPSPQPAAPPTREAAPAAEDKGPKLAGTGTGFYISTQGHIITNAHVVDDCEIVLSQKIGDLEVLAVDDESDLALLKAAPQPYFARLRGGRGPRVGESVMAMGFPYFGTLAKEPIVTTGIISALAGLRNDRRTIQISAPVQPGNSGGPLLGETGALVGVVNSGLDALKIAEERGSIPQNVNFAVSLGTLQAFLNVHSVPYALDTSSAVKRTSDISAEAVRYTMVLGCFK